MRHRRYVKRTPALRRLDAEHLDAAVRRIQHDTASRRLGTPLVVILVLFCLVIVPLWVLVFQFSAVAVPWLRSAGTPGPVLWLVIAAAVSVVPLGCLLGGWVWSRMGSRIASRELARRVRERRECVACGYDLEGIDDSEHCPECGAANLSAGGG